MLEAVIFDLDGTLVDSEQHGHRVAFNASFEHFGLPDRWSEERYRGLLAITGGERRLYTWLSSPESSYQDKTDTERREMAKALHRWKTERVQEMAANGEIPARNGVMEWLEQLEGAQIRLAVATTGSRQWAIPLLDNVFGRDRFEVVVAGDDVAERKPDPDAYLLALTRLQLRPDQAIAVEDSAPGWESARRANITCVVVANEETNLEPDAAPLVLNGFGTSTTGTTGTTIDDLYGVMNTAGNIANVLAALLARATIET